MQPTSQSDPNLAGTRPARHPAGARLGSRRPRRITQRVTNLILLIVFVPSSLLLSAMLYLVNNQCRWMQSQVDAKQAQLTAFTKQYDVGQRRLTALRSNKGNEEILIENGYIPPGDRILLFPATPEEQLKATASPNDLAPHGPLMGAVPPSATASSVWRSAGDVLHNWWVSARAAAGGKTAAKVVSTASNGATVPPEASGDETKDAANAAAPTDSTDANSTAAPTSPNSASPELSGHSDTTDNAISSPEPTDAPRTLRKRRRHALSVESAAAAHP